MRQKSQVKNIFVLIFLLVLYFIAMCLFVFVSKVQASETVRAGMFNMYFIENMKIIDLQSEDNTYSTRDFYVIQNFKNCINDVSIQNKIQNKLFPPACEKEHEGKKPVLAMQLDGTGRSLYIEFYDCGCMVDSLGEEYVIDRSEESNSLQYFFLGKVYKVSVDMDMLKEHLNTLGFKYGNI